MSIAYFTGCTALITGVTAGIGEEIARELAPYAETLILVARRTDRLQALEHELLRDNAQLTVHTRSVDLADEAQIDALTQWVRENGLNVNLLINNAGLGDHGEFASADWTRLKQIIAVNITALTKLSYLMLPVLHQTRPSAIINVSSIASFFPVPNSAVYAASKAYVTSLGEALRAELRGTGVRVTTVCPGPVDTEFGAVAERASKERHSPPPDFLKVPATQVAQQALLAAAGDRARVVPGLWNCLLMAVACAIPMFIVRLIINEAAQRSRRDEIAY
ncbi:MAG TPA: SDR family NAD(P)-dependent oxidoreductase [Chthoniobacteraceae bacterium]|nr:SDR family NAD(P)-dependent oxidoreductase [Chthoniobacteraceae bacterium]